jgi:hypothetical protein
MCTVASFACLGVWVSNDGWIGAHVSVSMRVPLEERHL